MGETVGSNRFFGKGSDMTLGVVQIADRVAVVKNWRRCEPWAILVVWEWVRSYAKNGGAVVTLDVDSLESATPVDVHAIACLLKALLPQGGDVRLIGVCGQTLSRLLRLRIFACLRKRPL